MCHSVSQCYYSVFSEKQNTPILIVIVSITLTLVLLLCVTVSQCFFKKTAQHTIPDPWHIIPGIDYTLCQGCHFCHHASHNVVLYTYSPRAFIIIIIILLYYYYLYLLFKIIIIIVLYINNTRSILC